MIDDDYPNQNSDDRSFEKPWDISYDSNGVVNFGNDEKADVCDNYDDFSEGEDEGEDAYSLYIRELLYDGNHAKDYIEKYRKLKGISKKEIINLEPSWLIKFYKYLKLFVTLSYRIFTRKL